MIGNLFLVAVAFYLAVLTALQPKNGTKQFLILVSILPLSYFFEVQFSILTFLKIYVVIHFFLCLWLFICRKVELKFSVNIVFSLSCFLLIYFLSPYYHQTASTAAFLRDIVPVLFLVILLLSGEIIARESKVSVRFIKKLVLLAILIDFIMYLSVHKFNIIPSGIRGEFYLRTGVVRYSDIFTLAAFALSSIFYFESKHNKLIWLSSILAISVMSLDRVFLLWSIIVLSHYFITHRNVLVNTLFYVVSVAIALASVQFVVNLTAENELVGRFAEMLSFDLLINALYERFGEPAVAGGYTLDWKTFLVGEGAGFKFYIPWFIYRELDPYQISVDSFFVANYVKYGVLGLLSLCLLIITPLFKVSVKAFLWLPIYLVVHNGILVDSFLLIISTTLLISYSTPAKENSKNAI